MTYMVPDIGMTWGFFILICFGTLALHIFADFHLQGCLADLKQRMWWKDNITQRGFGHRYDHDYLAALTVHGLEWSIFVHIPAFIWMFCCETPLSKGYWILAASVLIQAVLHAVIDDMKCNRLKLNLVQDQILHVIQLAMVIGTFVFAFTWFR